MRGAGFTWHAVHKLYRQFSMRVAEELGVPYARWLSIAEIATLLFIIIMTNLSDIPRFPLSIILSYLQQKTPSSTTSTFQNNNDYFPLLPHNRDAISLLITNKRFTYTILPLFTVPKHLCNNYTYTTKEGKDVIIIEKYRFIALPIQDPNTLLDRLKTRRLRRRIVWSNSNKNKNSIKSLDNGIIDNLILQATIKQRCYQYGRTIEELAFEEWTMLHINHHQDDRTSNEKWRLWPAHLELLRFLDDSSRDGDITKDNSCRKFSIQRRTISSPFCFRPTLSSNNNNEQSKNSPSEHSTSQVFGNNGSITLLASYPRSGNTLLRTLLERITSTVTGSDTRPDRTLSKSLAIDHDLVGEGLVGRPNSMNTQQTKSKSFSTSTQILQQQYQGAYDPLVHIVKTHFPERKGWKPITGNKVLLLVRNPYDAIDSYWNLCCTNTHTRSLDESVYSKYADKFEGLAKHEIKVWCEFHYYWLDMCERENIPLLLIRYEDLVLDTETEMIRIINFLNDEQEHQSNSSSNESNVKSFWKWRVQHAIGTTKSKSTTANTNTTTANLGSYQPRSSNGGLNSIGKSIRKKRYSESVLCHMHEIAASMELDSKHNSKKKRNGSSNKLDTLLCRFGYDIYTQQFPENFKEAPPVLSSAVTSKKGNGTVLINKTPEIRSKDDEYGRPMTFWRRGETDGDKQPFPTVPR